MLNNNPLLLIITHETVGYPKAPEQSQSSARPICQSHTMTSTGHKPATISIGAYWSLPRYALCHRRQLSTPIPYGITTKEWNRSLINSYSASHDNWCTETLWNRVITAQCEGMGEVGSARYEPALLPPCPSIRVLCYSNWTYGEFRPTIICLV